MVGKQLFSRLKAWQGNAALLLLILYPLLFIWQGLDFTDTGYLLTNYQQIFHDPASVEASFRIWLTNIIGGIWIFLFGNSLGLIGYRLAAVFLVYFTVYIAFLFLKPYLPRKTLIWGLFLAVIFINRSGFQFNYNSLTAFFYVCAAYFLSIGLQKNKNCFLFLSAFSLALNIFIRLPNLLGVSLVLGIFFDGYLKKTPFTGQLKRTLYFFSGYFLAILLVLFAMYLMGHLEGYLSAVQEASLMLLDRFGHHYSDRLVGVIFRLYKMVLMKIGLLIFGLLGIWILLTITSKFRSKLFQGGIIFGMTLTWIYFNHDFYRDWCGMVSFVLGILYICLFLSLFKREKNELRLISFTALVILVITPLGSADVLFNAVMGMYLAIPLSFNYLVTVKEMGNAGEMKLIKIIAVGLFVVFTMNSAYHFTYRDSTNRLEMVYGINHKMLKGVFTTKDRARIVQELLDVLPHYVQEGDYLLAYEYIPLVYFLTQTRPYLYNAWPMLFRPAKFERSLNRAFHDRPYLPVIIRARGSTENMNWPDTAGLSKDNYYLNEHRRIMDEFIRKNHYQIEWQNRFFEILLPSFKEE